MNEEGMLFRKPERKKNIFEKLSDKMLKVAILNDINNKQSPFSKNPDLWMDASHKIGRNQSIFTFLAEKQFPDTPENRVKVAIAYTREKIIPNLNWLVDPKEPIPTDHLEINGSFFEIMSLYDGLYRLFNGDNDTLGELDESGSLHRHGIRSGVLALFIYDKIKPNKVKTLGFSKEEMAPSVYGALMHDWGRLFNQGLLGHEQSEDQFFKGIHLKEEIYSSIHKPVPRDRNITFGKKEASEYDSFPQALVRICDLYGKINIERNLRTTTYESWINSINRQLAAAEKNETPYIDDPKKMNDLTCYCFREDLALKAAIEKMGKLGVDVFKCFKKINNNSNIINSSFQGLVR